MKAFEVIASADPLAQLAISGIALTIVVTLVLFGFLMTRRDPKRA